MFELHTLLHLSSCIFHLLVCCQHYPGSGETYPLSTCPDEQIPIICTKPVSVHFNAMDDMV